MLQQLRGHSDSHGDSHGHSSGGTGSHPHARRELSSSLGKRTGAKRTRIAGNSAGGRIGGSSGGDGSSSVTCGGGGGAAADGVGGNAEGADAACLAVAPVPSSTLAWFRRRAPGTSAPGAPASGCAERVGEAASGLDEELAEGEVSAQMACIPERLASSLMGFQRVGVRAVLRWRARALLADEMGLGKTRQAIACLGALRPWPALLVVPASLRILWAEQLEMWLAELLAPSDVRVIAGASDALHQSERCPKVVTSASRMAAARHRTLTLTAPPDPDPHRHQRS